MTLDEFVANFAAEFDDTSVETFSGSTSFRELKEWSSLVALSIISMIDEQYDIQITGADIRSVSTIEELYNLVENK